MLNIISVDFEEWYHPEYVKDKCPENKKDNAPQDLRKALDLLEKCKSEATFFVVGEIAQRYPEMIEQIRDNGHEVAFHGYDHEPLWKKSAETFRSEIKLFSSAVGKNCIGFRAPSFSLDNRSRWALKILEESGYKYDSSIFPAKTSLYGVPDAPLKPYKPSLSDLTIDDPDGKIWEFPLLVYPLSSFRLPVAGGFYLRFLPVRLMLKAIEKANKNGYPAVLYFHTWELNPETPKLKLGFYKTFVTYHNLKQTQAKLKRILAVSDFTGIGNFMEKSGLA